ncbi:hypothetical protein GS928_23550 [Rhodococcus hoagii]|nr:hypothetical protein [Prescottella equi]
MAAARHRVESASHSRHLAIQEQILTTFDVNGGWTRDNFAQSVQDDLGKAATAMQGSKNGTPAALKVWVGTEAQYNAATNNGANEAANTIYLRGA